MVLVNDIIQQNPGLFMAALDTDTHFTNILLDDTIYICIELIFKEGNLLIIGHFFDIEGERILNHIKLCHDVSEIQN